MITRGCLVLTLIVNNVLSLPLSSNHVDKDDAKVMKCIVEVIADTLSKPSPIPISQECLDSLRGDERIISILRHQNLLKELQELATQGASERAQQQKKSNDLADRISAVLEDHVDKDDIADRSMLKALEKPRREGLRGQSQVAAKREAENEVEESLAPEEGSREGNDIEEAKEEGEGENASKHVTNSLSEEGERATTGEEEAEEEGEAMQEKQETPKPRSEEGAESTERDGTALEKKDNTENETEEEDSSQVDKDGTETTSVTTVPEVPKEEKSSLEGEDKDGEEQRQERRSGEEEEKVKEKEEEEEEEGEKKKKKCCPEGEEGNADDDEEVEKNGEDSKRWSRMDELAEQLSSRKRSQGVRGVQEEEEEEEEEVGGKSTEVSQTPPHLNRDLTEQPPSMPHHSKEDSGEGEGARTPEVAELRRMALKEAEEKRDEEGSASRKAEDHEIESLAAIESELENVAQKLHELRRG
ncbi:chromogranin-A [Amia ocellicauda]|uniref:chromogranin-A n=1 Tax=Amia ocellicauda TaxID=2972642 RepID=UPI0034642D14